MNKNASMNKNSFINEDLTDIDKVIEGLESVKSRNVTSKLVDDNKYSIDVDDATVNDLIDDLMSEDLIDKEGNKLQSNSISCGNILVRKLDNNFDKFTDAMKNVSPGELKKIKEKIQFAIQKDPFLVDSLDNLGIDLNNFENYLGSVEVLTIERRRVFNIFEVKK